MPRKMKKHAAASGDGPPAKRTKLLSDDEGSDVEGIFDGGVPLVDNNILNINKEFAQRFEHNKKREEKQRRTYLYHLLPASACQYTPPS